MKNLYESMDDYIKSEESSQKNDLNEGLSSSDIKKATDAIKKYVKSFGKKANGKADDVAAKISDMINWPIKKTNQLADYLISINNGDDIIIFESVNEGHDMTHPIEMENNRMMRSSAAEFTRYLTRKAHESRPENFIEKGVQPITERMPIKEEISNLPLNENPNRVYGMFTDDQGKPSKLDKELLDIAIQGLPPKVVKNIDAVEANGYGKSNAISPHSASKKGVGTGSVAYHKIHIGLLKPMGPKKIQAITLGLRKRTSGPGTGYIYMKVAPDFRHTYGPDAEAATEFWMDNQHAAEKIKELTDNKFKKYLG